MPHNFPAADRSGTSVRWCRMHRHQSIRPIDYQEHRLLFKYGPGISDRSISIGLFGERATCWITTGTHTRCTNREAHRVWPGTHSSTEKTHVVWRHRSAPSRIHTAWLKRRGRRLPRSDQLLGERRRNRASLTVTYDDLRSFHGEKWKKRKRKVGKECDKLHNARRRVKSRFVGGEFKIFFLAQPLAPSRSTT